MQNDLPGSKLQAGWQVAGKKRRHVHRRHGLGIKITFAKITTQRHQQVMLNLGFNPFGDHLEPEVVRHDHHRFRQGQIVATGSERLIQTTKSGLIFLSSLIGVIFTGLMKFT